MFILFRVIDYIFAFKNVIRLGHEHQSNIRSIMPDALFVFGSHFPSVLLALIYIIFQGLVESVSKLV